MLVLPCKVTEMLATSRACSMASRGCGPLDCQSPGCDGSISGASIPGQQMSLAPAKGLCH